MTEKEITRDKHHWLAMLMLRVIALLILILTFPADFVSQNAKVIADYEMSFYVAGRLVDEGLTSNLYPNAACKTYLDSPFNKEAHRILPQLPESKASNFMYSPIVAWLFAPLSLLTPSWAFALWQAINLGVLYFAARLFASATSMRPLDLSVWMLAFMPLFANLWVGQLAVVCGLLPIVLAFHCLKRNRPVLAGLTLSLLFLKPQFLLIAFFIALLAWTNGRCLTGLCLGITAILAGSVLCLGPHIFMNWTQSLRYSEQLISSGQYQFPHYLLASIPCALLVQLADDLKHQWKWFIYLACSLPALIVFFVTVKYRLQRTLEQSLPQIILFACFFEVIASPHLLLYDLSIFAFPGILVLRQPASSVAAKRLVIGGWLALGAYTLVCLYLNPNPLILVSIMLVLAALFSVSFLTKSVSGEAPSDADSLQLRPH